MDALVRARGSATANGPPRPQQQATEVRDQYLRSTGVVRDLRSILQCCYGQSVRAAGAGSGAECGSQVCRAPHPRESACPSAQVSAIRNTLQALFSEARLPDNPYYFLSSVLSAYVDQSALWLEANDEGILSVYEYDGSIDVLDPRTGLCCHSGTEHCYGLPHVLRLVSKDGVATLHRVLTEGLPDTFCPSHTPFNTKNGCTVQLLSSVQGLATVWRPAWSEMPEIQVRTDVLVRAARLEDAVGVFLDAVLTALEDVAEVPVYFVNGVDILDPPHHTYQGLKQPFHQFFPLESVLLGVQDWEKTAKRLVLGGKCIQMRCAVLLDTALTGETRYSAPAPNMGPGHSYAGSDRLHTRQSQGTGAQEQHLRYHIATRTFYFHYASLESSSVAYDQMQHYGTLPFDALFSGYFPTQAAASAYAAMYQTDDKIAPYLQPHLQTNAGSLRNQVERHLLHGDSLRGFQVLMHLILLQDKQVTSARPLQASHIRPLYKLISSAAHHTQKSGQAQAAALTALFATLPNIIRILTSSAAFIQGMTRELEAISSAATAWPGKLSRFQALARINPEHRVYTQRPDGLYTAPDTGDSRRTLRTPEVTSATLTWLNTFDLEGKLLEQLVALKGRISAGFGRGLFSGVSILCEQLLSLLPSEPPRSRTAEALAAAQPVLSQLLQLLEVGSVTVAQGFLGRCANVVWALRQLGISQVSLVGHRTVGMASAGGEGTSDSNNSAVSDPDTWRPNLDDWSLDVASVTTSQVRVGAIPGRVGPEGVMLQYSVDTHLDDTLRSVWLEVSKPPQPLNPFPKLMHLIRSRAAKMELWREGVDVALERLLSHLVLVRPPVWVYAAQVSHTRARKREKLVRRQAGSEDVSRVYGSYASVALTDACEAQRQATQLPELLDASHWKRGAYTGEVIPCLLGDMSLSSALQERTPVPAIHGLGGAVMTDKSAQEQRWFRLSVQHMHLVQGPLKREAAEVFADQVLSYVSQLQSESLHLIHSLTCHLLPNSKQYLAHQARQQSGAGLATPHTSDGSLARGDTRQQAAGTSVSSHLRPPLILPEIEERVVVEGVTLCPVTFTVSELLDTDTRPLIIDCLAAAAMSVKPGKRLAFVNLFAASKQQTTYMAVRLSITFLHTKQPPPLLNNQAMVMSAPALLPPRPRTADRDALYWDRDVYEQVFVCESAALMWAAWHADKGDPAQPFHVQKLASDSYTQVRSLTSEGRLLGAHKVALRAAVAMQDDLAIYELSRSACSAAQELSVLRDLNLTLRQLLCVRGQDPVLVKKRNKERLRHIFLTYCERIEEAFASPRTCYFSCLSAMCPPVLESLKRDVLSSFEFEDWHLEAMERLYVWTCACEISVAAALDECFAPTVRRKWLAAGDATTGPASASNAGSGVAADHASSAVLRPSSALHPNRPGSARVQYTASVAHVTTLDKTAAVPAHSTAAYLDALTDEW